MPDWTEQQRAVISSDSRKIICSAAAGSGKTAVMIERIVRLLKEGAKPERFLVVTFTNAAASEMKTKIRDRMERDRGDRNIRKALERFDLMEITTIHSFCQHLIRDEFPVAGADPFFTICEAGRSKKFFEEAFRAACASLQKEQNPDYEHWKKCFSRTDTEEIIRSVYNFMMSLPDPFEWLDRACDEIPLRVDPGHRWFQTASEIVTEKIRAANMILRRQFEMFSEPEHGDKLRETWKADRELFHVKQLWAEGKKVSEEELNAGFVRMAAWNGLNRLEADWKERYSALRDQLKKIAKEIDPLIRPDPEAIARDLENLRATLRGLKILTLRTAGNYTAKKYKRRMLDFTDLEHYALRILRDEETGPAVRRRYTEVFVDECQDVSRVQDEIIQLLSSGKGRLFMVGDVKQSIYRFRLAEPMLFQNRTEEYGEADSDEKKLLKLRTNFRSRPEILETVNTVFRDIMDRDTAEIGYEGEELEKPGFSFAGFHPVQADVLEPDPERPKLEVTADDVAVRIRELLKEEKDSGEGNYTYRDIVILMPRVSGDGQKLADLLEKRGIPVFFDGGGDFYEKPEVAAFMALLKTISHPYRDEPLILALKSAPFFFTEEELARVRLRKMDRDAPFSAAFKACLEEESEIGDRCREADAKIRAWQKQSRYMQLGEFVRYVCSDSHHVAMAGVSYSAGNHAQQNLYAFCRKAEAAEKAYIFSLNRFLAYVSEQEGGGDQRAATPLADGDNVVRIMTMHKSKGLQFPVVFCLGLDGALAHRNESSVMTDADLGICLKYKKPEYRLSRPSAAQILFEWKKEKEQRAERIRLLYVAMTRAQERMFLVGVGEDEPLWQAPKGLHRVLSAQTYLDWIVPALRDAEKDSTGYAQGETPWKITFLSVNQQEPVEKQEIHPHFREWLESLLLEPPVEEMWKEQQKEPYLSDMQKKSVTFLVRHAEYAAAEEEDEEETPEDKRIPERFAAAIERGNLRQYPEFMAPPPEKYGAWRGTMIHRFLSLTDLEKIRQAGEDGLVPALEQMKEEMRGENIFSQEEAAVVRPEDAAEYYRSALGKRMLASAEVHREWAFNLYKPERSLLVQGIVDCAFLEDGAWILVDYKTDRVEDEQEFAEIYRPQLRWYAEALEDLTGKAVKEAWLYSISKQKAIFAF